MINITITDTFKAVDLLDIDFKDVSKVNIIYNFTKINKKEIESLLVFFYNKTLDSEETQKLEIESTMKNLTTQNKIELLKLVLSDKEFIVDDSLIECLFLLSRSESVQEMSTWNNNFFNDVSEFIDIKLGLMQEISDFIRSFIIYYHSLFARLSGNKILHNSSPLELTLVMKKGLQYYGELLASFSSSNMNPISGDELYIINNVNKIYVSMLFNSVTLSNLDLLNKLATEDIKWSNQ